MFDHTPDPWTNQVGPDPINSPTFEDQLAGDDFFFAVEGTESSHNRQEPPEVDPSTRPPKLEALDVWTQLQHFGQIEEAEAS